MEQRREARFETNQSVGVIVLADDRPRLTGIVKNASGRGLGLLVPEALRPGTALKLELADAFALCEVMYCRQVEGGYLAGLQIEQVLSGLQELDRMMQEFTEELKRGEIPVRR